MKYRVEYYPQTGPRRTVDVEAENAKAAIDKLVDDPNYPLAQVVECRTELNVSAIAETA